MVSGDGGNRMSRRHTWVLVMSSTRARILRNLEDPGEETPVELVSRAAATHLRDALSQPAGRSIASDHSGRRSAIEPGSDPVLRDMQDFAEETAALLEQHRHAGDFTRLAVFAEPKMLGILRAECPAALWAMVFLDQPLNLIALSPHDLRARVEELIRNAPGDRQP